MKRYTCIMAMVISIGILFVMGAQGLYSFLCGKGSSFVLAWYDPFAIIITGIACSLVSNILPIDKNVSRLQGYLRILLHFVTTLAVVCAIGYLSKWYRSVMEFLFVFVTYVIVYVGTWIFMFCYMRNEEKRLNQALQNIQDEE